MLSNKEVEILKKRYQPGCKVQLTADINDPYNHDLISGQKGTVTSVDDAGQIHVSWECGSSLALIPEEDSFCKI